MSSNTNYLYNGPRVLVPVQVKAMLVDQRNLLSQDDLWARNKALYNNNLYINFSGAFPRGFGTSKVSTDTNNDPPAKGIHLQWSLPEGLTHGYHQKDKQQLNFYQAPNRWLVVRLWRKDKQLHSTGWVIASNYLWKDGTSPYWVNQAPTTTKVQLPKNPNTTKIGKAYTWKKSSQWTTIPSTKQTDLRGVAPLNPAFNTYSVDNQNVFSFVDKADYTDLGFESAAALQANGVILRYLVVGWYQNPKEKDTSFAARTVYQDPIYTPKFNLTDFVEKLTELNWDVRGTTGLTEALNNFKTHFPHGTPTISPITLCHGAIHSICWHGADYVGIKSNSRPGTPKESQIGQGVVPGITLGNSPFDALAAFVKKKLKDNGVHGKELAYCLDFMYALYYNNLESFANTNGPGQLSRLVNDTWYESHSGGSYWEIALNPKVKATKTLKQKMKTVFGDLKVANELQETLDQINGQLESLVKELWLSMYAYDYVSATASTIKEWATISQNIYKSIQSLQASIKKKESNLSKKLGAIKRALGIEAGKADNNFQLKEVPKPKYWLPNDLVVCVYAANTYGQIGGKEGLPCRISGQTLRSLTLNKHPHQKPIQPSFSFPEGVDKNLLPKETEDLIKELLLLDPNLSDYLYPSDPSTIQKQQTMIWNSELYEGFNVEKLTKYAGFTGIRPAFRGFQTYTPPWSPLYIDWGGLIAPNSKNGNAWKVAPQTLEKNPNSPMKNWTLLNGQEEKDWNLWNNYFDYQWQSPKNPQNYIPKVPQDSSYQNYTNNNLISIAGRSLISSHVPNVLKERLEHLNLKNFTAKQKAIIQTVTGLLEGFDIITQRLSGFTEYYNKIDITNKIPTGLLVGFLQENTPSSFSSKEFIEIYELLKKQNLGVPIHFNNVETFNFLYIIRSGFFRLNFLRIVDNFGIGYYPLGTTGSGVFNPNFWLRIPKGIGLTNKDIATNSHITTKAWVQLPPRLTQFSKMTMEWIDADKTNTPIPPVTQAAENTPVCGWVIPNHLDKSLMIFDASGHYLISIGVYESNGKKVVGNQVNPLENPTIHNSFLKDFVHQLLTTTPSEFNAFLEQIDVAMWYTAPKRPANQQGLSALLGRPLALVRTMVTLDLKGVPSQNFDMNDPTGGFNSLYKFKPYNPQQTSTIPNPYRLNTIPFEFYMGVPSLPDNGLIGYFADKDFSTFYVPKLHTEGPSTGFIKQRSAHTTTLNNDGMAIPDKARQHFTMLVDYRGSTHLVSGLNPVFDLKLPNHFCENALANMNVLFRMGPILTDPNQLRMPKLANASQKTAWVYQSGAQIWKNDHKIKGKAAFENSNIEAATSTPIFPNQRNTINEGWLAFKEAQGKDE